MQEGEQEEGAANGEDQMQVNGVDHDMDQTMANGDATQDDGAPTQVGLTGERQPNKNRVTTPYLTKYERARILGTRALQIRYAIFLFAIRILLLRIPSA
jgi:DNA-directed RNA polymerases I, II, and III subunit RPABC2